MNRNTYEKGAIMVEATIYLPLILCTVMALIYLALFNMQGYMMMFQAQRVAAVAAREEAWMGYEYFGMGADNEIDFDWGAVVPSSEDVTAYYEAHNTRASDMYRELTGWFTDRSGGYESRFADAARDTSLLTLMNISSPDVTITKGFLGTEITVSFEQSLPMPGAIRYLGLADQMTLREAAYTYSLNPTSFVRNVDLAVDLTSYVLEKLGWEDNVNGFMDKTKEILGMIL